jgi:hypothetical protein
MNRLTVSISPCVIGQHGKSRYEKGELRLLAGALPDHLILQFGMLTLIISMAERRTGYGAQRTANGKSDRSAN